MEMKSRILVRSEPMRAQVTVLGHPLHAILTDFPLGALTLSVLWNFIALLKDAQPWYAMTFWTMLVGLILVVPAALVGLLDYAKVLRREHPGARTATVHLFTNVSASLLFLLSLVFRGGAGPMTGAAKAWTFILAIAGLAVLSFGGYLGGKLVYEHRIGVNPFDENDCV
jgi:uncharacterized membrane protein